MKREIFLDVPLTGCIKDAPEAMVLRMQCTDVTAGGLGFVLDLLKKDKIVLSTGLRASEGLFISLYLKKVTGRTPSFPHDQSVAKMWKTQIRMALYSFEGETNAESGMWVEDGAIWVGYIYAGQLIARAKLDAAQLAGLIRLADELNAIFGGRSE